MSGKKRALALIWTAVWLLSSPVSCTAFAQEQAVEAPAAVETQAEEQNEPPQAEAPAEEEEMHDEVNPVVPEGTQSGAAELPETTPAPESSATPAPEELQTAFAPEETPAPLPTSEIAIDATIEPEEMQETSGNIDLLTKVDAQEYYHLDASRLCIPDEGMAIPQIYQGDYRLPVCLFEGENKSVASSGCGATAASMLIAYIAKDYDQTPYTLFYWAATHGRYHGDGLSFSTVRQMLSNHGVRSRMQRVSADAIREALEADQPIIMLMGPGTFTRDGHYIVLRGLDADGMVLVNDPASSGRSANRYSLNLIVREAKGDEMLVVVNGQKRKSVSEAASQTAPANTPAPSAAPTPMAVGEIYSAVVAVECVNLRAEIGAQGEIIMQLRQGAEVQVLEEYTLASGNIWCKVRCEGQELYMRADMLERLN